MASLLIKEISNDVHEWLKEEAKRNRRSMTKQAAVVLEQAARCLPPLRPIKPVKTKKPFTHEWLLRAMKEGRE